MAKVFYISAELPAYNKQYRDNLLASGGGGLVLECWVLHGD
ncbi:MAG: hypothetical protein VX576_05905 [Pseudomonadota bacterium]|nr:hypothetical protein [Pseudomonadota bacterium]